MMGRRGMWSIAMTMLVIGVSSGLSIEKSAYKDVVIEIKDNVPVEECGKILADLEVSATFF